MVALFPSGGQGGSPDVDSEVHSMRQEGLTDDQILKELKAKGVKEQRVISALSKLGGPGGQDFPGMGSKEGMPQMLTSEPRQSAFGGPSEMPPMPQMPNHGMPGPSSSSHGTGVLDSSQDLYERIEEITEEMIDEKWDDLIKEVRKIVEWKNTVESKMQKMDSDVSKLKEDFKLLHQGVMGKVQEYDERMQEVGTELKAVGKVFKDVVPVFTENVKELRSITKDMKK